MPTIEIIIFLLVVLVVFSAIVERLKIPQSIMLVVAGLVIGFTPQLPDIDLKPDTVFLIFLPPLLFTASWKLSWHDVKAEKGAVISLSTGLVFFTTIAIAAVAHYFIPGFSWQLGFILGAVISPPDAMAATSITKGLNLNKRVVTILEGESLLNDASALVAYRYAILSMVTGGFIFWKASLQFIWIASGGLAIGVLIGWLLLWALRRIKDNVTLEVALTLLTPYSAYLLAEHFHMSGVLSVVAAGLFVSFRSPEAFSFQTRIQTSSFWNTIEFLLNGFVFILIGMQLPGIISNIEKKSLLDALGYGLLITAVAIVVRILWVFPGAYIPVWLSKKGLRDTRKIDWRYVTVISWTGMRGVVSLAAALAIPLALNNGDDFPQRNMILFITFCVIFFTLVVQGLSLPFLIKLLNISNDDSRQVDEEKKVRRMLALQVVAFIDGQLNTKDNDDRVIRRLRNKYTARVKLAGGVHAPAEGAPENQTSVTDLYMQYANVQKALLDFERALLVDMHKEDAASSGILKKLQDELDIEESRLTVQLNRVV